MEKGGNRCPACVPHSTFFTVRSDAVRYPNFNSRLQNVSRRGDQ
jgi:hypothetical protein